MGSRLLSLHTNAMEPSPTLDLHLQPRPLPTATPQGIQTLRGPTSMPTVMSPTALLLVAPSCLQGALVLTQRESCPSLAPTLGQIPM